MATLNTPVEVPVNVGVRLDPKKTWVPLSLVITIGIAVDNGIHYIYRFREEYALTNNYVETLHICHSNIGKAVFYTTMTIIFGFSILMLSNFIPTIYFGVLTGAAMFAALMGALLLLPQLIITFKPFGPGAEQ